MTTPIEKPATPGQKRRVGRPTIAAQSPEEALQMQRCGTLPKRPRSESERLVMARKRGAPTQPNSRTQQAALLAAYAVKEDGIALAAAARNAAEIYGIKAADNVRKYARKILNGPQVTVKSRISGPFSQLAQARTAPLLSEVLDANADSL